MKNIINYYYNLYPDEIIKKNNNYYFFYENIKYYITLLERPIEDLNDIININNKLLNINKCGYIIMKNKNNNYYIEYENKNYIVMKIITIEDDKIKLLNLVNFDGLIKTNNKSKLLRNNWGKLWSDKVDYFEYQMSVMKTNELIENSFNYYVGMAENAISYYENTMIEENVVIKEYTIAHKRINYPITNSKIYNPLTFIFDYEVRDISEYIKTSFFNNCLDYEEIETFIIERNYSPFYLRLLYARLLYPSYYFDVYENIQNINEKELKKILKLAKDYEDFLFDIYMTIKKISPIPEVSWIMRKGV